MSVLLYYSSSHFSKTIWKSQLSFLGDRQKYIYPSPGIHVGSSILYAFHKHDKTKTEAGVRKIEVNMGQEEIKISSLRSPAKPLPTKSKNPHTMNISWKGCQNRDNIAFIYGHLILNSNNLSLRPRYI